MAKMAKVKNVLTTFWLISRAVNARPVRGNTKLNGRIKVKSSKMQSVESRRGTALKNATESLQL